MRAVAASVSVGRQRSVEHATLGGRPGRGTVTSNLRACWSAASSSGCRWDMSIAKQKTRFGIATAPKS
jgi:hypothetical protein